MKLCSFERYSSAFPTEDFVGALRNPSLNSTWDYRSAVTIDIERNTVYPHLIGVS